MGINTSYADYVAEKDEHQRLFVEEVARIYGVEPYNVVPTSGASEAIFIAYSVLGAGGNAVVPLPNYEPMFTIPRSLGMTVRRSLSGGPGPKGAVYGLTDPNNPTAQSLEPEVVARLHNVSRKNGSVLFVNETYKEFTFPGRPVSLHQRYQDVVTCATMTKFYGLGRLRVGWMIADRKKADLLLRAKKLVSGHNSEYSLWIARQVLRKRTAFVARARRIYSDNSALVANFAEEVRAVAGTRIGGAPFCLVRYGKGPGAITFCTSLLRKTGVLVSPGDFFGAPKAFRLCFTGGSTDLRQGLDALAGFLRIPAR